jgi:hypothetical protein
MTANEELEDHLKTLAALGMTPTYLERALDLPVGEIAHWRGARVPFEAQALMRVVRAFPWVVMVAEADYSPREARRIFMHAAAEVDVGLPDTTTPLPPAEDPEDVCNCWEGVNDREGKRPCRHYRLVAGAGPFYNTDEPGACRCGAMGPPWRHKKDCAHD